ncbi:MAG: glycosyltransferase [Steroidobacteraceae bacterium]
MRILMVSDVYFPRVNGVSTSIRTYREDLERLGHHCTLVAPEYPGGHASDDLRILRVASRRVPRDPEDRIMRRRALQKLLPRLAAERFDLVHVQTPFVAHYAAIELARALRLPVVESYHTYFEHYLHHYVPALPSAWLRYLARRFTVSQCGQVDVVISPSRQMADALRAYGVATRIEVLPTGLDPIRFAPAVGARFRARHGIGAHRPLLLFVGRVAFEKNIDFLIRLMPALSQRVPEVLLLIAGEGPARTHCEALVRKLRIEEQVQFVGYMNRNSELLDCYRAADAFVFASRTETQGLVLLEAMAQGTPVVSTAVMGTVDVLRDAQGAIVVPEEPEVYVAALADLLSDPPWRAELSRHALRDAERWSSLAMAQRLVALYESVTQVREVASSSRAGHFAGAAENRAA